MHGNTKMYPPYVGKNAVLHDIQELTLTETRQTSSKHCLYSDTTANYTIMENQECVLLRLVLSSL